MAGKRKRHRPVKSDNVPSKRHKMAGSTPCTIVAHPTLSLYYPSIWTLKDYVLGKLPSNSKTRRRKIAGIGRHATSGDYDVCDHSEAALAKLLDRTLVCRIEDGAGTAVGTREQDLRTFSQRNEGVDESSLLEGNTAQSEIVDFAIWHLFHRIHRTSHKPAHILCHGYQRTNVPLADDDHGSLPGIPGIVLHYPNSHVATMKAPPWSDLLHVLGKDGEQIMLGLMLDCALYVAVERGKGNYYQLSGVPMTDLQPRTTMHAIQTTSAPKVSPTPSKQGKGSIPIVRSPSAITFVRNRMFYARAALNAKGKVRFGLRHIHVLNRYPDPDNPSHTTHILKYIFPRQFGLHNVFTSTVDPKQTVQPFQDYSLREQEIARKATSPTKHGIQTKPRLPRRLRGRGFQIVQKLQKLHARCAYYELLKHYCPLSCRKAALASNPRFEASQRPKLANDKSGSMLALPSIATQISMGHGPSTLEAEIVIVDHATPVSNVSAFCRAVIANLLPNEIWGQGVEGDHNKETVMRQVDHFTRLRRFESLTLHSVVQCLKVGSMGWLAPPHVPSNSAISSPDLDKRRELLLEFLYYLFDSILIPLIRSNFHVTESNHHKNRIFYFRHDVWRALTEPAMTRIKDSMFEEVPLTKARQLLDARTLGFSQIRLLPKGTGLRPIMNLRRRVTKLQGGKALLGRSINSIMAPVHKMFDLERQQQPSCTGSSLFSVGDMYPKLKAFRDRLLSSMGRLPALYFAKVDVKSCFDTIPQRAAVKIMERLALEDVYRIARHAQIKCSHPLEIHHKTHKQAKPARKFVASAHPPLDFRSFDELVEESLSSEKTTTVFVDNVLRTTYKKQKLLDLLRDHVERNIVKIGKKFFRQKDGIPQGSVLSSLLCNCFYAEFEQRHLPFVKGDNCLLLRLIDDFLFITTKKAEAVTFLRTMHDGMEEFGVRVNPAKSLANFDAVVNGSSISRTKTASPFPYCGSTIDTRTLAISKDRDRGKATALADALTVEQSNTPGQVFHRKAMNAFKIQTHRMFLDTNFNPVSDVLGNIYQNFVEAAMKYYRYVKLMRASKQPHKALLIETLQSMVEMACVLVKAKHRNQRRQDYSCAVSRRQVEWMALTAFDTVLGRKQTNFQPVLGWVRKALEDVRAKDSREALRLVKVAQKGQAAFQGFRY